ncbi:MAG: hypothetical protein JXA10_10980 [Anaerolineae bacterium]|nr:hypothetical protein [Anaerolineae bacterium]
MTAYSDHDMEQDTGEPDRLALVKRALRAVWQGIRAVRRPTPGEPSARRHANRIEIEVHHPMPRPAVSPPVDQAVVEDTDQGEKQVPPPMSRRLPNPKMVYKGERRSRRPSQPRRTRQENDADDDYQSAE